MDILYTIILTINILIFIYLIMVNGFYITMMLFSYIQIRKAGKTENLYNLTGLFSTELYRSASILAPAYNEEVSIIDSVRALLNLEYSNYEVIVINDGSTDSTLEKLIDHFELTEVDRHISRDFRTQPVKRILGSEKHPNLFVIDKENGRKADALNSGINLSRNDMILAIDSDSLPERDVLKKMLMVFIQDQNTIAVGGVIRVANGCTFRHGLAETIRTPSSYIGRLQAVEYLRSFLFGHTSWDYLNSMLLISGAFGVFDRQALIRVGGYQRDTVGEDIELVVRMHRYHIEHKIPYRVRFLPLAVCWTEVPENWKDLARQRNRWHRGLADTLFRHRKLLFRPRYGRIGLLAMPFFLFVEFFAPVIELGGYLIFTLSWIFGVINWQFFTFFMGICILLGIFLSVLTVFLEELTIRKYDRVQDVVILVLFAVLENIGYRQLHAWWRFKGVIDYLKGKKEWGEMTRSKTF